MSAEVKGTYPKFKFFHYTELHDSLYPPSIPHITLPKVSKVVFFFTFYLEKYFNWHKKQQNLQ